MIKPVKKEDFAYSVGVVRVLETMLLNDNEVERMLLAKDSADAFRILNELDYADNKTGISDPAEFHHVLTEGLKDIKDQLSGIVPDKGVMNIIWYNFDFHNIKTMVKAKILELPYEDIEPNLIQLGAIPLSALKAFIYDGENVSFKMESQRNEEYLKSKLRKVFELYERVKDPQAIDLFLDQKMIKIIHRIARMSGDEYLLNYVKTLIDLNNIRLFFRMKSQQKEVELFEMAVLWKGHIDPSKFIDAFKKHSLSEFAELMKSTAYSKIIAEGYKSYEETGSFAELEKQTENHLTNYYKLAKLTPFGPGPIIAYFLAKKNNTMIIRMIMVNKLNGVEPEEIKSRLRKIY